MKYGVFFLDTQLCLWLYISSTAVIAEVVVWKEVRERPGPREQVLNVFHSEVWAVPASSAKIIAIVKSLPSSTTSRPEEDKETF